MNFQRFIQCICVLAFACAAAGAATGQEVDYDKNQYDSFQEAVNEPEPMARENKLLAFLKANPTISLAAYAENAYLQMIQEYRTRGRTDRVSEAGEKLLSIRPNNVSALYFTAEAAFTQKRYDKAVLYGERAYAGDPTVEIAYLLAFSFQQLGKEEKFLAYARKVAEGTSPREYTPGHFQILSGLRDQAVLKKKWGEASGYAGLVLEGFETAEIPDGWDAYIRSQKVISYVVLGQAANVKEDWAGVISNYGRVIPLTDRSVALGEAYFYIGLANWRQNKLDPAMNAFARGSAQSGAHADACQRHLETIYKSINNGSLAGLDEFKARAITDDPSLLD